MCGPNSQLSADGSDLFLRSRLRGERDARRLRSRSSGGGGGGGSTGECPPHSHDSGDGEHCTCDDGFSVNDAGNACVADGPAGGVANDTCNTSADCLNGFRCDDDGTCVEDRDGFDDDRNNSFSGGCSSSGAQGSLVALGVLLLLVAARTRRLRRRLPVAPHKERPMMKGANFSIAVVSILFSVACGHSNEDDSKNNRASRFEDGNTVPRNLEGADESDDEPSPPTTQPPSSPPAPDDDPSQPAPSEPPSEHPCDEFSCDVGTTCVDGAACVDTMIVIVDRELPVFDCNGATHFQLEMSSTDAIVIHDDNSTIEGAVGVTGSHLDIAIPNELNGTTSNEIRGADLLLAFDVGEAHCAAIGYEFVDAFDAEYTNTFFDDFEPDLFIDTWDIVLGQFGQMAARETMEFEFDGNTEVTDHFGVYAVDEGHINAAFLEPDGSTFTFEGDLDEFHNVTNSSGETMFAR